MTFLSCVFSSVVSSEARFGTARRWSLLLQELLEERSALDLIAGTSNYWTIGHATTVPPNDLYADGLNRSKSLLRKLAGSETLSAGIELKTEGQVSCRFSIVEVSIDREHNVVSPAFALSLPEGNLPANWVEAVVRLFTQHALMSEALEGWGHLARDVGDSAPRTMKFSWPRPLRADQLCPQVEFYGWLVWLPPSLVKGLGGPAALQVEVPAATLHEVHRIDGAALVAQLGPDPRTLGEDDLRAWRLALGPVMNVLPGYEVGQREGLRPLGVLPEDW
jgi:hypothetical protein